jgi:uncharacterized protein
MHAIRCRFLVPAFVASVVMPALSVAQEPARPDAPSIDATGSGQVRIPPERALVVLSVETRGPSAAAISVANARIQTRVLDTLRALGIAGADVATQAFNVSPDWAAGPAGRRQSGHVARNSIRVTISQLDRIGMVIDAALARGATGVGGVSFTSSKSDSAHRAALAEAARNARADADALARAFGGSLGELLESSTTASGRPMIMTRTAEAYLGDATSITPSDLTITASVRARWRFVGR